MQNCNFKVDGNKLVITVDLDERHGVSESGKTVRIASTEGNAKLDGKFAGIHVGLNVYTKDKSVTTGKASAATATAKAA